MGVTIYYHGGLDDPAQLDAALAMMRDECAQRGWSYRAHDFSARGTFKTYSTRSVPSDLPGVTDNTVETHSVEMNTRWRGLIIQPHPKSESLVLMFDPQTGRLMSLMDVPDGHLLTYQLGIKTQFAPIDTHVAVCEVLRHLQVEFCPTQLHVHDEGSYFDTEDVEVLRRARQQIDDAFDNLELLMRLTQYATAGEKVEPPDDEQLAGRRN